MWHCYSLEQQPRLSQYCELPCQPRGLPIEGSKVNVQRLPQEEAVMVSKKAISARGAVKYISKIELIVTRLAFFASLLYTL